MTFCGEHEGGCGASLTQSDYEAGFCTQCKRQLSTKESGTMTETEARNASVGDKVQWPDGTYGDVIEKGYNAFKVKWYDNQISVVWFDDSGGLRQKIAVVKEAQ